jgi:hypothetical protein
MLSSFGACGSLLGRHGRGEDAPGDARRGERFHFVEAFCLESRHECGRRLRDRAAAERAVVAISARIRGRGGGTLRARRVRGVWTWTVGGRWVDGSRTLLRRLAVDRQLLSPRERLFAVNAQ